MMLRAKYANYPNARMVCGKYGNGAIAVYFETEMGERILVATVALDEAPPSGYALIKNWSENEGVLDYLVKEGLVEDTGETIPTGYVQANLVKLLFNPADYA